jgi:predicted glycosyltransferase
MRHRILFYTHDSYGLGHFRRSLTIASFLARHVDDLSILMLTGLEAAGAFEAPRGIDLVKLPGVWKSGPEEYRSRHLRVSFNRVRRLREHMVRTVVRTFDPSMMVVDNVPRGVGGELLPTLRYLRRQRPSTRTVLTMRDVLDEPARIIPQWQRLDVYSVLRRLYDEIWVAGCQSIFDPVAMYEIPVAVEPKVKFCGYVVRHAERNSREDLRRELRLGEQPIAVVSCGGGGDGFPLIRAYLDAVAPFARQGLTSAVFLGPDMPAEERRQLKASLLSAGDRFLFYDFRPDLVSFLDIAAVSVSMGGYNTMCEVAARGMPAVVVPRVHPRLEQLLRAEAFAARGLVRVVHPDRLAPASLQAALGDALGAGTVPVRRQAPDDLEFAGLGRILRRVRKHLQLVEAA